MNTRQGRLRMRIVDRALLISVAIVAMTPIAVFVPSNIAGHVTDNTGSVLPGVTVEATNPEGSHLVVTDGHGRYVIDLRPGTYDFRFTLPGFDTVERQDVILESDLVATLDIEMQPPIRMAPDKCMVCPSVARVTLRVIA